MGEDPQYDRALTRVRKLRGFYLHAMVFVIVNVGLAVINLIRSPDHLWFYWATLGWGIALVAHALNVYGGYRPLGAEWQDRKARELVARERDVHHG